MLGTRFSQYDEESVDINTAGELKSTEAIEKLRKELPLTPEQRTVTEHFFHDNGLTDELLPMVDHYEDTYRRIIDDKIRHDEWLKREELTPFIVKEKTRLLVAMKQLKSKKMAALVNAHNDDYSHQCSAALPNQYIQLNNTYHYIKKNIIIALYNAARDYYNIIMRKHSTRTEELAAKIESFNNKFAGIAEINPENLAISPISQAHAKMAHLSLIKSEHVPSFESMVNELIKRCAHTSNSWKHEYGDAFECVQKRMNTLNETPYLDPLTGEKISGKLFHPIAAPMQDSKASILRIIPLVPTAANLTSTLKSFVAGEPDQFVFSNSTRQLDDQISQSKQTFRDQLDDFCEYIQTVRENARKQLEGDEDELAYDAAINNINAYGDLLNEHDNMTKRINLFDKAITSYFKKLEPNIHARTELSRLVEAFDETATETLARCVFDERETDIIAHITSALNQLRKDLVEVKQNIDKLINASFDNESMFIKNSFAYAHTATVIAIKQQLESLGERLPAISNQIDGIQDNQQNATRLIQSFEHVNQSEAAYQTFKERYLDKHLRFPRAQNATNDILTPAIAFYESAQQAAVALEKQMDEHIEQLRTTKDHYQKMTAEEHRATLTSTLDQLQNDIKRLRDQISDALTFSQKESNTLLLCHLYVNTLLNLDHWQQVTNITDTTKNIRSGELTYRVPAVICDLILLIKHYDYSNWDNRPERAEKLLIAMHDLAAKPTRNRRAERFLSHLRRDEITSTANTEGLRNTIRMLSELCDSKAPAIEPTLIQPTRLDNINVTPSFWEKHPVIKKALIGLAIGIALLTLTAIVLGTLGVAGGIIAGVTLGIVATSTAIGFAVAHFQEKRSHHTRPKETNDRSRSTNTYIFESLGYDPNAVSTPTSSGLLVTSDADIPFSSQDEENTPGLLTIDAVIDTGEDRRRSFDNLK